MTNEILIPQKYKSVDENEYGIALCIIGLEKNAEYSDFEININGTSVSTDIDTENTWRTHPVYIRGLVKDEAYECECEFSKNGIKKHLHCKCFTEQDKHRVSFMPSGGKTGLKASEMQILMDTSEE